LRRTGLDQQCQTPAWTPISNERLARVHDLDYAQSVALLARQGGGRIEADTVVSQRSSEVALFAAGAVADAVSRVVAGEDKQALCLVRPPGHHALRDDAMGFCLFNNVAVGASVATAELGLDRVLIVDWDVHHGNGTQNAFWENEQVGFLSIHRWPFYPGSGWKDETGAGSGLGATLNLPIEMGISRPDYLHCLADELDRFASKLRPQLILLSAGFDTHRADPVGSLGLETEDFEPLTDLVLDVANSYSDGRVVGVLEGGYNTGILAGCVEVHLRRMLAREDKRGEEKRG
jgi:acetoin utilization deacetylase AcuC-like enzyme